MTEELDGRITSWLLYLADVENLRPSTVKTYRCAIRAWASFLTERPHLPSKGKECLATIHEYCSWVVANRGKAGRVADSDTLQTYIAALSSFMAWEVRLGHRKKNHCHELKRRKRDRNHRELLSTAIVRDLFSATGDLTDPWSPEQGRVVLSLLVGCGLRPGELRDIRWNDVDLDRGIIALSGDQQKGRKESLLLIPRRFLQYHQAWTADRLQRLGGIPNGDPHYLLHRADRPLGQEAVYTLFRRIKALANLERPYLTPHALRHLFITGAYMIGGPVEAQALGRHADFRTTAEIYVHLQQAAYRSVADQVADWIWSEGLPARPGQLSLFGAPEPNVQLPVH